MLSKTWNVIFNNLPVPVSLRKTSGLLFLVSWCFPAAQHQQMKALWMLPKTNKMHSTVAKHSIPWEMIRKSWDLSDLVRTSVLVKTTIFLRYWIFFYVLHTRTVKRTDFLLIGQATIMDKILGALLHFWGVFQFTQVEPLPSPHKQRWTRISRIFSEFQLCIGWGRENCKKKKIKKERAVLWGNPWKWQKNMNIALNVPRTFVHDCLNPGFWIKSLFLYFSYAF